MADATARESGDLLSQALAMSELAADAGTDAMRRFAALGRLTTLPRGHALWRAGAHAERVVLPVTGEAETVHVTADGREVIDRFVGPGDFLGIVSVADGGPHPTDARVVRGGTFFVVERSEFQRFVAEHPAAQRSVVRMIARLYRRGLRERDDVIALQVRQRLARFLLRHTCVRGADGARILLHAGHAEIAARLGTVREVVARSFAALAVEGLVARAGPTLYVADWDGLVGEAAFDEGFPEEPNALVKAPARRTHLFFLTSRAESQREDAVCCLRRLGDLSLCRARGCVGALRTVAPRRL
jgi:CRP/FNR family transcriptional regulator